MNMMTELKDVRHGGVLHAKMRVAGEQIGGTRTLDVHNPYTGVLVGTVPKATYEEVETGRTGRCILRQHAANPVVQDSYFELPHFPCASMPAT